MKVSPLTQVIVPIITLIIGIIIGRFVLPIIFPPSSPTITSYQECVAAGYPILETYPEQCLTPDGQSFTNQNIPQQEPSPPQNPNESVFCTMDAMECPDGSFVGRIPPSCNFAPCPGN